MMNTQIDANRITFHTPHSFCTTVKLTEVDLREADLHNQECEALDLCEAPVEYKVILADAPELLMNPDSYMLCLHHAEVMLGQHLISFLTRDR
jgi:hypothetical protein